MQIGYASIQSTSSIHFISISFEIKWKAWSIESISLRCTEQELIEGRRYPLQVLDNVLFLYMDFSFFTLTTEIGFSNDENCFGWKKLLEHDRKSKYFDQCNFVLSPEKNLFDIKT
ncbi:hypothetical protein M0804_006965 [Polistes exclamans]|nr:hypothetical protein M0804_006965 [Polistes exclamans]